MTKHRRFKAIYGSEPRVIAAMWEAHINSSDQDAFSDPTEMSMRHYLLGHNLMASYDTVEKRAAMFKLSKNTVVKWGNDSICRIAALAATKIVWPQEWGNVGALLAGDAASAGDIDTTFKLSIDGTQSRSQERKNPEFRKNKEDYSFKFGQAGINTEIGLDLHQDRVVWISDPYPASTHDLTIFRKPNGLKEKMEATGNIKAIGDKGHRGEGELISIHNAEDSEEVREFKKRALARHESLNSRLKNFACLSERFRHKFHNFKMFFNAVAVTVQFQMENGSPLFGPV